MPKLPVKNAPLPAPAEQETIEGELVSSIYLPEAVPITPALPVPSPAAPAPVPANTISEAMDYGAIFAASGMFPDVQSQAQAVVKILAGRAYGLDPFQAMTGIYIVQGRVTLSAALIAGLVKSSGKYDYRVREHTELACVIDFYCRGEMIGTSTFTIKDAQAAGLANRPVWKSYPRNMLFARAMSNGVRWFCADLTYSPVYTPDEMGGQAVIKEITN